MNLIVDQGNTFVKYGVFEGRTLVKSGVLERIDRVLFDELCTDYSIDRVITSSVSSSLDELKSWSVEKQIACISFSLDLKLPVRVEYATPQTLGLDRVAAVIGAYEFSQTSNFLVIDAGTAITYEFVENNIYRGGNISPGVNTRFKALNHFTQKLPLVAPLEAWDNCGNSTETAIRSGVLQGLLYEIQGYIDEFTSRYEDASFFLTGGDSIFFVNKLKNSIFAHQHLVLYGLNRVLFDNVKN